MTASKITIGNVEIASLSDGLLEFDICNFFPDIPAADWEPFHDHLTPERKVSFNLACFVVRSEGKTIAIDTGLGAKDTPETPWGELLDDLERNGLSPNDIDAVVMTHLHRDHVGWNTVRDDGGNAGAHLPQRAVLLQPGRLRCQPRPCAPAGPVPQRARVCVAHRRNGAGGMDGG